MILEKTLYLFLRKVASDLTPNLLDYTISVLLIHKRMKKIYLMLLILVLGASGYSQFLTGDCCTCYSFQYGSNDGFYRDSTIQFIIDRDYGSLEESFFTRYSYSNGELAETIGYRFDPDFYQRVESYLQIKKHNPNEKNTERLNYRWDKDYQSWKESSRGLSYYNDEKKLTHSTDFRFNENSNNWENNFMNETFYENNGATRINSTKKWDALSGKWVINSKNTCTDDIIKLQRTCISSKWKEETADWETTQKTVNQYNTDRRLAEMFLYSWDKESETWGNLRHFEYEYDLPGRKTKWYSWIYDEESGEKISRGHQQYIYDEHGNNSEILSLSWNKDTKEWTVYQKQVHYWSKAGEESLKELFSASLTVYPNPFSDQARLNLSGITNIQKIELIDIYSKVVRTYTYDNTEEMIIDRDGLKPGVYFLNVYADKIFTARIVIH